MSSNTVGELKKFLAQFEDDCVVYGYEEVGGFDFDGKGPSAIVVVKADGDLEAFPTGNYGFSSEREPSLADT